MSFADRGCSCLLFIHICHEAINLLKPCGMMPQFMSIEKLLYAWVAVTFPDVNQAIHQVTFQRHRQIVTSNSPAIHD